LRHESWSDDSRPIALFRVLLSLLLLKDAVYHVFVAGWFYSDSGVVPRQALWDGLAHEVRFSIMDLLSTEWMAIAFFLGWVAVLVGLLTGHRARLMACLNFVLILSIHERNVYVLTGADTVMRVFSFWLIFAPLNEYYAIDRIRIEKTFLSHTLPIFILRLQFVLIYVFTGYLKLIEGIWTRGEALGYVLQLESLLLPPGKLLQLHAPNGLLTLMTYLVLLTELALPFLLFLPFARVRLIGIVAGALLHTGIALTLAIPDFSLMMLAGYALFFDPKWIDRVERQGKRIWSPASRMNENSAPGKQPRWKFLNILLLPLMVLVVWWNIDATREYRHTAVPAMPLSLKNVIWISGLWQYWDLFAPVPYQIDGRTVVEGRFENGTAYDLFNNLPLNVPVSPIQMGPLMRWKKFEEVMFNNGYPQILSRWAEYYCNRFNSGAISGTRLSEVTIRYVYRRSHLPGQPQNELQSEPLWIHSCLSNQVVSTP
jgi:hypothetical protein